MSRKTRKLIWSAPLVAVLAGALAMFVALGTVNVFANPLPGAPMNLTVEAASGDTGRTTLVLNWDAPANASGYRIDISDRGAVWETMMMDTGNANTSYMDTTLTADDVRWYRVFAVNSHEIGPVSNAASGTTDKKVNPGSVMNPRAVPNAKKPYNHIDLSWDAPTMDGGEKIVGYEVQYHDGSQWGNLRGTEVTPNNVTRTTKTSITDISTGAAELDPGDKRLYRVRAINGPTTVSDTDTVAVPGTDAAELSRSEKWLRVEGMTKEASDPGQVTGLTAVNAAAASINLYWYDPADTGGWAIDGYLVQASRHGKKFPSIPKNADLTDTAISGNLGDGTNPDNANHYVARTSTPNVLQASFIGIEEVDHDGDESDGNDDGTAPQQVTWYFRVFAVTVDDGPDDATNTQADHEDNEDNVIRRSRNASNEAGDVGAARTFDHDEDSDRTDGVTSTPDVDPLVAPGIDPTGSTDDSDHIKQEIRLVLTLDESATAANVKQIAYRIDYSKDGIGWKLLEDDTRFTEFGEGKPYDDDKDLAFDETRYYRVFTIGKDPYTDVGLPSVDTDTTPEMGSTAASTIPDAPTGVMASSPSLRSIMASWTVPEDNGGQAVVKYYYQYVLDDGDGVAEATDFDADTNSNALVTVDPAVNVTDDAMTMGTFEIKSPTPVLRGEDVYVFRVAAVNKTLAGGDRPATTDTGDDINWSAGALFDTTEAAKPGAVEGLTSEAATDTSGDVTGVNLLWNKPSDKITIMNYDVEVQDGDGDWVNPQGGENLSNSRTSYTDPDEPEMDEMRVYRVRATNMVGDGPWTMVDYPREPAAHMDHILGDASGLTAVNNGDGTVTLSWTPGPNSNIHWVAAARRDGAGFNTGAGSTVWEKADMAASHTVDVSNLHAGTYAFTVIAGQYDADTGTENWDSAWTAFADDPAP